jgi:predicted transglutaminase-like cysteine proteinase
VHTKKVIFCIALLTATLYGNIAGAGLFGSIEKKNRDLGDFPKWTEMLTRLKIGESSCELKRNCNVSGWETFIQSQKGNPDKVAVLKAVNRFVNNVKYIEDVANWGQSDYWETPYEFFSKGGDCEDFSIAKFITLQKIGFDNDDMRIVILNNTRTNILHAVLVVKVGGTAYLLDNQIPIVEEANDIRYYRPIYSINETNWWKHS